MRFLGSTLALVLGMLWFLGALLNQINGNATVTS